MSFIKDELEVEQIMGNVIGYFIRIGFDEKVEKSLSGT